MFRNSEFITLAILGGAFVATFGSLIYRGLIKGEHLEGEPLEPKAGEEEISILEHKDSDSTAGSGAQVEERLRQEEVEARSVKRVAERLGLTNGTWLPMRLVDSEDADDFDRYVGSKCCKTGPSRNNTPTDLGFSEPKPFKSGSKINTIKGVIYHPILLIPAFTFEEDDSYVECRRIIVFAEGV